VQSRRIQFWLLLHDHCHFWVTSHLGFKRLEVVVISGPWSLIYRLATFRLQQSRLCSKDRRLSILDALSRSLMTELLFQLCRIINLPFLMAIDDLVELIFWSRTIISVLIKQTLNIVTPALVEHWRRRKIFLPCCLRLLLWQQTRQRITSDENRFHIGVSCNLWCSGLRSLMSFLLVEQQYVEVLSWAWWSGRLWHGWLEDPRRAFGFGKRTCVFSRHFIYTEVLKPIQILTVNLFNKK